MSKRRHVSRAERTILESARKVELDSKARPVGQGGDLSDYQGGHKLIVTDDALAMERVVEIPDSALLPDLAAGRHSKWYTVGECYVYFRIEALLGYHLSISHRTRYPTWYEVMSARYQLVPSDITMALLLPPLAVYNEARKHSHGFELWQVQRDALQQSSEPLRSGGA